jgi:hypothetical protein
MAADPGVLGVFAGAGDAARAITALKAAGHADVRAAMPAQFREVTEALGRPQSRIGWITVAGAVAGVGAGLALCIATSLSWPLVTGGKPIVSIPPFVVIAFEVSVLVGALVNLASLIITTARARRRRSVPFDARFALDRVGIFAAGGNVDEAERLLRVSGAEEVRRVE